MSKKKKLTKKMNKAKTRKERSSGRQSLEERIEELKQQAYEISGGKMVSGEFSDTPLEVQLQFWENVVAIEEAPEHRPFDILIESGLSLPPPDELDDAQLTAKLWELIGALDLMGVYLERTDHLSDRELYSHLWNDSLREQFILLPNNPNSAWHIDLIGSGSEEHHQTNLQYYADEAERSSWADDWPDYEMPDPKPLPYDRDRRLPQPRYGQDLGTH